MDSLKKLDVKGKRVRVTDDSGCRYVGTVEYVDYQRGKLGITGAVEGSQGTKKSLQMHRHRKHREATAKPSLN